MSSTDVSDNWMEILAAPHENKPMAFQILDVQVVDCLPSPLDTSGDGYKGEAFLENILDIQAEKDDDRQVPKQCHVLLFGCTEHGNSVLARVSGFKPSLFFEVPSYGDASLRRGRRQP